MMNQRSRIYLDNAATSWPKPEAVYRAVEHYQRELGASPARGIYAESVEVDQAMHAARAAVAQLIGAERSEQIVFTLNGSDSLNLAIHGLLRDGDHVVTSVVDHNSVLRPLRWLEERGRIDVTRVPCGADGVVDPDSFAAAMKTNTRLVALVHASNVTGALQPVEEAGRIAHEHGALMLVDAAQSLGHVPIAVGQMNVDLLAAPGHKGLMGPVGTGILYIRPGVERELESLRQGGTGTHSDEDRQPDSLPDKYEPGNLNALGIFGLDAALHWLGERTVEAIRRHAEELTTRMFEGFSSIRGVRVYGPCDAERQVGVVSITIPGYSPAEVATILEGHYRVQVRAGIHCAPLMHESLGTLVRGGTVRFSIGPFTTAEEIDTAVRAVEEITTAHVELV